MIYDEIELTYYHPVFKLALAGPRSVWLLEAEPKEIKATVYRGALVFRLPGSRKRVSYKALTKGLVKKTVIIRQPMNPIPF